jgi:hypothetical protein
MDLNESNLHEITTKMTNQITNSTDINLARIREQQRREVRQRELLRAEQIRTMSPENFRAVNEAIQRSGERAWRERNPNRD